MCCATFFGQGQAAEVKYSLSVSYVMVLEVNILFTYAIDACLRSSFLNG